MSRLPDVDFLLRPTHIVTDEAGIFHGLLSNYHPASCLHRTMGSLHPDAEKLVLAPFGADRSVCAPTATTADSVAWSVKLAWAIDVAASVAWLHAQAVFWGDLKTENIVLCTDGHCRLIDYCPGGWTILWCPPEAQRRDWSTTSEDWNPTAEKQPDWTATAEGDVFALGLVLWAIAREVGTFEREKHYVSPLLCWSQGTPHWFQRLASSCLEHDPDRRPSVPTVYETLMHEYTLLASSM